MEPIHEMLQELEEDGIQYAPFFSHPAQPGYYGVMIRERTPEYIRQWLPYGPLKEYTLELSQPMDDAEFLEFMLQTYTDQKKVKVLQALCKIDLSDMDDILSEFKDWKQDQVRLERVKFLEQYPWEVTAARKSL